MPVSNCVAISIFKLMRLSLLKEKAAFFLKTTLFFAHWQLTPAVLSLLCWQGFAPPPSSPQ